MLLNNSSIQNIISVKIHPIIISDHAPISLKVDNFYFKGPSVWRFNISLLEDPNFDTYIRKEWDFFLKDNDTPDISSSVLWETWKAVIKGEIITYSSHKKKQSILENDLKKKYKILIDLYTKKSDQSLWEQIQKIKFQIENITLKSKIYWVKIYLTWV